MLQAKQPRIGLALGSGGSRGLAHVGVIKVLSDAGYRISAIAGSSAGALAGALYARDTDIERLEKAMTSTTWKDVMKVLFDFSLRGGVVKGRRLAEFVKHELGSRSFSDLVVPFAAVATELKTGRKTIFTDGKVGTAVMASMAVPFVFPPVTIGRTLYVDGGVVEPVPVQAVRMLGCDVVIAVNLDGKELVRFTGSTSKPFDVMNQTLNIFRHNVARLNVMHADVVLEPNTGVKGIIGWEGFLNGQRIVRSGERAMRAALPELKRILENWQ